MRQINICFLVCIFYLFYYGCTSQTLQRRPLSSTQPTIKIIKPSIRHNPYNTKGWFVLLEYDNGSYKIVKISQNPIDRQSKSQEILFVDANITYIQPAFERVICNNASGMYESDYLPGRNHIINYRNKLSPVPYTPYSSNFTKGSSWLFGKDISSKKILSTVKQTNLIDTIVKYNHLYTIFKQEEKKYHIFISNIQVKVSEVKDKTGLFPYTPAQVIKFFQYRKFGEEVNFPERGFDYTEEQICNLFQGRKIRVYISLKNPIEKTKTIKIKEKAGGEYTLIPYYTLRFHGSIPSEKSKAILVYEQGIIPIIKVPVIINTCDVVNPYPHGYKIEDNNISVKLLSLDYDMRLEVSNKTSSYIKISSITLYYRGKVLNTSGLNIKLPPESCAKDIFIPSGFNTPSLQEVRIFKQITRENIRKQLLDFGIAVEYTIGKTNKTLYKTTTYNLADIIDLK